VRSREAFAPVDDVLNAGIDAVASESAAEGRKTGDVLCSLFDQVEYTKYY
jgi:hypothetical protein